MRRSVLLPACYMPIVSAWAACCGIFAVVQADEPPTVTPNGAAAAASVDPTINAALANAERLAREAFAKRPEFAERKKLDEQLAKGASKRTDDEQLTLLIQRAELAAKLFAAAAKQLPGFPGSAPELTKDVIDRYNAAAEHCRGRNDFKHAILLYERLDSALGVSHPFDYWQRVDARVKARGAEACDKATVGAVLSLSGGTLAIFMGKNLENQGRYREAIVQVTQGAASCERVLGQESSEYIWALKTLAGIHRSQSNYSEAERLYARTILLTERTYGKHHPSYAEAQNDLGSLYFSLGKYTQALECLEEAARVYEATIGTDNYNYALFTNNIGASLNNLARFRESEPLFRSALVIARKHAGEKSELYGLILSNLGYLYDCRAEYPRAAEYYEQAVEVYEQVMGKNHPETLRTLNMQGDMLVETGKYAAAEPLFQRILAGQKKMLGDKHPDYAGALYSLGTLYRQQGNYAAAEPYFREAMAVNVAAYGERSSAHAVGLNYIGSLRWSQGRYDEAIAHFEQALAMFREVYGEKSRGVARTLDNIGSALTMQGKFLEAEEPILKSVEIYKAVYGNDHTAVAFAQSNLANAYVGLADFDSAERLQRRNLEIFLHAYGRESLPYARTLANLGQVYGRRAEYEKALDVFRESRACYLAAVGDKHPEYARSLSQVAAAYKHLGRLEESSKLLEQARVLQETLLGKSHPDYATTTQTLASVRFWQNRSEESRALYRELIDRTRADEGNDYQGLPGRLLGLASLEHAVGNYAIAEALGREALERSQTWTERVMEAQAERRQLAMAAEQGRLLDGYLAIALDARAYTEQAYGFALRHKGSAWMQQRRLRAAADDPKSAPLFQELQRTTSQIASRAMSEPKPEQRAAWREEIERLTAEKETLERRLASESSAFRTARHVTTVQDVRNVLPEDVVLCDILEFDRLRRPDAAQAGKPLEPERRLAAFIVRQTGPIELVELGSADEVAAAVDAWRASYGASPEGIDAGQKLRTLVWLPLEAHLKSGQTVLVSPDGVLGRFPLAALPGRAEGTYLLEDWALATVPVAQALPSILAEKPDSPVELGNLLLIGGVDYDADESYAAPQLAKKSFGRRVARGAEWRKFEPLTGAVGEIAVIEKTYRDLFGDAGLTRLEKAAAEEERFKAEAPKHLFLHVATHGFFAPPELRSALAASKDDEPGEATGGGSSRSLGGEGPALVGQHPGLLSGLALAGANRPPSPDRADGILTAEEVQTLDLRHVDLAVLSACETGLGEVAGGEGLLGLQRSFQVAGARTTIAGYWKVDDLATRLLMERFYRNLWDKEMPRLIALREAQLYLLNNPDAVRGAEPPEDEPRLRTAARYWAAFALSGDWR